MVVNLCLPHFETTVHCNKLCADGYDVSNLLSGDPTFRRRGFKLEYFLRPPVQVTLQFQVRVEVCRVDMELWPCGMDLGRASRGLEIHTSSAALPPNQAQGRSQEGGQFLLVGRCELKDEVSVSFSQPCIRPRPPFPRLPPEPSPEARRAELWSRGPQSLGAVTQLRICLPYGGAGSALGLRALAVWGLPARCCSLQDLERMVRAHKDSLRVSAPVSHSPQPSSSSPDGPITDTPGLHASSSNTPIPEEFLDPLTQELMTLPLLLPSGAVIDSSTLEEYQRQEATWGRLPNDPFTGVPFSVDSKPLPCPQLKGRIDRFLLQAGGGGLGGKEGQLGRTVQQEQPHPSRLAGCRPPQAQTQPPLHSSGRPQNGPALQMPTSSHSGPVLESAVCRRGDGDMTTEKTQERTSAQNQGPDSSSQTAMLVLTRKRALQVQRDSSGSSGTGPTTLPLQDVEGSTPSSPSDSQLPAKKARTETPSSPHPSSGSSSHEQRLAESLDQALNSALSGFPAFTSRHGRESSATESQASRTSEGESSCVSCSCSLSQYHSSISAFRLPCGHLLCRPCLSLKHPPKVPRPPLRCPTCQTPAPSSAITRVHY
ncbi:RING finger protein 37 [Megalops cyprinoides]|uniref:RING finger protein 37 n=1 Tax=Megalops cyprinoides TaxID=118141 RepID=UPI0018654030|nr:RING finger protein 37 [Megalops cyprinoides]XP_036382433.1 RING finger protein 37 [Megalops cyprinoides]XP_036382434.1 RING finger protein 37 [Megalops cyprinoides]